MFKTTILFLIFSSLCFTSAWSQEYSPSEVEMVSCDVSDEKGNQITLNGNLSGTFNVKINGKWKSSEIFKFPIKDLDVDALNEIRKSCYRIRWEVKDLLESFKQLKKVTITLPPKSGVKDLDAATSLIHSIKGSDIVKEGAEKDSSPAVVDSELFPEGKDSRFSNKKKKPSAQSTAQ